MFLHGVPRDVPYQQAGVVVLGARLVIRSAAGRDFDEEVAYPFDQARIVIGRGATADVRIPHLTVSEVHATLGLEGDGYVVVDPGSTNGTRVNGERLVVGRKKRLRDGDRLEIGVYALSFHAGAVVTKPITVERTAELARRLYREAQRPGAVGAARLVVLGGPKMGTRLEIPSAPARLLVGRGETCQLVLDDPEVSREHMEVVHDLEGVAIRNLASKNGVDANGEFVMSRRLRDGDELRLGSTRLLFEEPAEQPIEALTGERDRVLPKRASDPVAEATPPSVPLEPRGTAVTDADPEPPPPQPLATADLVIYAVAALVLAASAAGLFVLLRAE